MEKRIHKFAEYRKTVLLEANTIANSSQISTGKTVLVSQADSQAIKSGAHPVSNGQQVKDLQSLLISLGFMSISYKDQAGKIHPSNDGVFGPKTKQSVIAYQTKSGLKPDGIVGKATITKLITTVEPKQPQITQKIEKTATDNPTWSDRLHQFGQEFTSAVTSTKNSIVTFWEEHNPLDKLKEIGHDVLMKLPLHLRGFFEYIIGRTDKFTENNMNPDELAELKKYAIERMGKGFNYNWWKSQSNEVVPTALTSTGQKKEVEAASASGAQQASLVNPADSTKFLYFFGDVPPNNIIKQGNSIIVRDNYDMNYWDSKDPGNKETLMKGLSSALAGYMNGEASAYSVIRSAAGLRETGGYKGFPVEIHLT